METYSVEAILSATDKGFTKAMKDADSSLGGLDDKSKKAGVSIGDIAKGVGVFKLVDSAVNMVTGSLGGAINRFDTLNKYPTVMQALGYSTQEVDKSMNKLTNGIEGLPTKLDSIVSSAQQLSISAGSLDKGTDYAIAFNNAMLSSGASTAEAEGALTQFSQALGKGKLQGDEFNSVASASPLLMSKMAESFGYGAKGTTDLKEALSSGKITAQQFADKMVELNDGVGGFADLAQKNSKGIKTSFENIKSAVIKGVEKTVRALDEGLKGAGLGSIADNLDKVKNVVNQAFGTINAVIPPMIKMFVDFLGVIKPFLPLITALVGWWVTYSVMVGTVSKVTKTATAVQKVFNAVMAANPYVALVAAIITLVATIVYLWKTNEDFRNAVIKIWDAIKSFISDAVDAIVNVWDKMKETMSNLWNGIVEKASEVWTAVTTVIMNIISPFIDIFMNLWNGLSISLSQVWDGIKSIASGAWELIKAVIMGPVLIVIDLITGDFTNLGNDLQLIWDSIKQGASDIWNGIKDVITGLVKAIVEYVKFSFELQKEVISNVWNYIKDLASEVWNNIKNTVSNLADSAVNGLKNAWNKGLQWTKDIFDGIKNAIEAIGNVDLFAAGKAIIDSFINGLQQTWEAGKKFVGGIADWIRKHKGPISYDRKLLIPAGKAIMDSLNAGLDTGFGKVQDNVNDMTKFFANTAFNQDFEIGANFSDLDRKINSMNNMNLSSNNELTLKNSAQPAEIKLNMGGRVFSAFVEDISAVMQAETDLNLQN